MTKILALESHKKNVWVVFIASVWLQSEISMLLYLLPLQVPMPIRMNKNVNFRFAIIAYI